VWFVDSACFRLLEENKQLRRQKQIPCGDDKQEKQLQRQGQLQLQKRV
jgi:hypothetical protein